MKRILVCVAAMALLLAGCAGGAGTSADDDPKAALAESLQALSEAEGLDLGFSLRSTPEDLVALAEDSGDELSADEAEKILASSISIAGSQGDDPEDTGDDSAEIVVTIDGREDLELRVVENVLYLRAEVASIFETLGEDSQEIDQLVSQTQGRAGFEWLEPAVSGEWVSVKNPEQVMGAGASQPSAQQDQMVQGIADAVEESAEVTSEGEEDEGTHLVATLPLRDVYEQIGDDLASMGGTVPGMDMPSPSEVPDEDLVVDFWVSDGTLTQMEVDLVQLGRIEGEEVPEGVDEFALLVTFEEFSGGIEPVADAIEIDPTAVSQAVTGMMQGVGGTGGGGLPPGFDCSQLEGAPPEVLELYKRECPELQ